MDRRAEKAIELVEQAQTLGLRLEFDSGLLLLVRRKGSSAGAFIAELGGYLSDVRRLIERRAIAARANEFLGQRIWSAEGEGVLAGASSDGELSVTIRREGAQRPLTLTSKAEALLLILDDDGREDGLHTPQPKPVRAIERWPEPAVDLFTRAQTLGLRLAFDSGLLTVVKPKDSNHDVFIAELGGYLSDVRRLIERRAIAARANEFLGQRIWSAEGEGVLAGASSDGQLVVTIHREGVPETVTTAVEMLLFLLNEDGREDGDGPKSAQSPRGFFARLRGPRKD
jgi:hypothetical protein